MAAFRFRADMRKSSLPKAPSPPPLCLQDRAASSAYRWRKTPEEPEHEGKRDTNHELVWPKCALTGDL